MARVDSSSPDISPCYLSYIFSPVEVVKMNRIRIPIDIKILNFLATQSEPVTIDQIDDAIDCYPNIIASYLKDLTEKGMVITIDDTKPKMFFLANYN